MDDSQGGGKRKKAAEELILRTIAAHAESLLRTARRHSICVDDAQDAYQRAIEIFMSHARRLDPARAPGWLHVVVKREAQVIQRARHELLTSTEVDLDGQEAGGLPTPEESALRFDTLRRSAEALKLLKPHELRALWLRAEGHSYSDISTITGWSYTKVNRCLSEGRRHFLEHYRGIESGEECKRWLPVLSAMVDGEASPEQILDVRPHLRNCPGCRATLKALQHSTTPLAALLPVPFLVADSGIGDQIAQCATRLYEGLAGGLHERAVSSFTKAQAIFEASAAGKVGVVAASAAAVTSGGYASLERIVERPAAPHPLARLQASAPVAPAPKESWSPAAHRVRAAKTPAARSSAPDSATKRNAFGTPSTHRRLTFAPEFGPKPKAASMSSRRVFAAAARPAPSPPQPPSDASPAKPAPEFARSGPADEFTP